MKLLGEIVQSGFVGAANERAHLGGFVGSDLVGFRQHQRSLDGVLNLFKGLGMGNLLVQDLDDVEAILSLHEVRDFAFFQVEGHGLKLRNSLALNDPAEVATLVLAARIFGVLLGEFGEILAAAGLLQNIFGLFAGFFPFSVGFADGHEQDVLDMNAVGHFILLNVLLVLGFQLIVRNLDGLAKLVGIN